MQFTDLFNKHFPQSLNIADYFDDTENLDFFRDFEVCSFKEGCPGVQISNGFGSNCNLALSKRMKTKLASNNSNELKIIRMGSSKIAENVFIWVNN